MKSARFDDLVTGQFRVGRASPRAEASENFEAERLAETLAPPATEVILVFGCLDIFDRRHHDAWMRTTLTLDPDVAAKAKKGALKLGKPFKDVINAALRIGLEQVLKPSPAKLYRTKGSPMGLRHGFSYDNIAELLARAEGEDHR